jgi:magnesium transporter
MGYLGKAYHPPGTAPGTLVAHEGGELEIRLIDYGPSDFVEEVIESPEDCVPYLERDTRTWIQVNGRPDAGTLRALAQLFDLHELALEDILNTGQRPKMEAYDEQLFVVLSMPFYAEDGLVNEQISIFAGENYLVCFCPLHADPFEPVRRRVRPPSNPRFRQQGIDYLLYALVDLVVDAAFPVLEAFGNEIEELEEELLENPQRATLTQIHHVRRELLLLRRVLWPQREVVGRLMRSEYDLVTEAMHPFLRDCYDHSVQIIDLLESFREMSSSLLEVYMSSISNRTNEIMRVLTIIATIFIPLTFVTGIYGMNFSNPDSPWDMPELHWYYGYPFVWCVMIAVAGGLVWYFLRKKWL